MRRSASGHAGAVFWQPLLLSCPSQRSTCCCGCAASCGTDSACTCWCSCARLVAATVMFSWHTLVFLLSSPSAPPGAQHAHLFAWHAGITWWSCFVLGRHRAAHPSSAQLSFVALHVASCCSRWPQPVLGVVVTGCCCSQNRAVACRACDKWKGGCCAQLVARDSRGLQQDRET